MKFLVKVKNTDDEIIAGLLEYGTVDDILMGNICLVNEKIIKVVWINLNPAMEF